MHSAGRRWPRCQGCGLGWCASASHKLQRCIDDHRLHGKDVLRREQMLISAGLSTLEMLTLFSALPCHVLL